MYICNMTRYILPSMRGQKLLLDRQQGSHPAGSPTWAGHSAGLYCGTISLQHHSFATPVSGGENACLMHCSGVWEYERGVHEAAGAHEDRKKVQITFFPCSFQAAVSPGYSRHLENPQAISKVILVTTAGSDLGTLTSEALSRLID